MGYSRERLIRELGGLFMLVLGLVTLLGLLGLTSGTIVDGWTTLWQRLLGLGAFVVPAILVLLSVPIFRGDLGDVNTWPWKTLIGGEIAYLALLTTLHALPLWADPWRLAQDGGGGGLIGWGLSALIMGAPPGSGIGRLLTGLLALGVAVASAAWAATTAGVDLHRLLNLRPSQRSEPQPAESQPAPAPPAPKPVPRPSSKLSEAVSTLKIIATTDARPKRTPKRDRRLPSLDLLDEPESQTVDETQVQKKAEIIVRTLAQFGLPVQVTEVRHGPMVTQFGVEPGYTQKTGPDGEPWSQKVRVGQINALSNDLALALAAPTLRIEAPVPGRSIVGIEVPNDEISIVKLRGIIQAKVFRRLKSPLALALGRDVSGAPVAADLARMPHLLIAGATNSGKSVGISAMITCLAMNNSPEQLRLVIIDPKMVELVRFNGLPHILGRSEYELERITAVLRWVTHEMDDRYRCLAEVGARHLDDYNRGMKKGEALPRIVVFVDELADLMMFAPQETEQSITRIAQMARAVGIHLVVATQRPSTDVVTGLIKANFPARISFAVASQVDSRVILDTVGAQNLLGRGDMLFLSPESGHPIRVQGCFVSDREIEAVVNYWRRQIADKEPEEPPWESALRSPGTGTDLPDELLPDAIALVREEGGASASLLQRKLRVGFPRAAFLIDQMEEMGIVGPPETGGRQRDVFGPDEAQSGA